MFYLSFCLQLSLRLKMHCQQGAVVASSISPLNPGRIATMVLTLDGYSEIGEVRVKICYLFCLRHLIKSSHKSDIFFFS